MIRVTLASNAIHLEAARRLRDGLAPGGGVLEVLLWEPRRFALTAADRRRWPLRLPARPLSYLLLLPWALLGLVSELRLSHLCGVGRALRLLARQARGLCLLDDGLDQYRSRPRVIDPQAFPAGTPCWLFSDVPSFRADWCRRFACRELGPLYRPPSAPERAALRASLQPGLSGATVLLIDAPGLERLAASPARLPSPRLLVAHPVPAKRSWSLPAGPADRSWSGAPEALIAVFPGLVVVGESMTLLAALRLRPAGSPLLIALPVSVDPNLARLAQALAARDPSITVV